MGYTADMVLASMVLAPVILLGALPAVLLARKLRLMPLGIGTLIGYAMIVCGAYALVYLYTTADMLIVAPSRLQERFLGRQPGSPWTLVSFQRSGFQDPESEWHYRLAPADAAALRKKCESFVTFAGQRRCSLYSAMDERWFGSVELQGNELRLIDGLH